MTLFLGYDPGGAHKHGIAQAEIGPNGVFLAEPQVGTLAHAGEVCDWLRQNASATCLRRRLARFGFSIGRRVQR